MVPLRGTIKRKALACKGKALDCFPLGNHACCCFYCVKTKAQDQGHLKSSILTALACKGKALDCFPLGNHACALHKIKGFALAWSPFGGQSSAFKIFDKAARAVCAFCLVRDTKSCKDKGN